MKSKIIFHLSIATAIASALFVVSCYKLDPRDNKFDPGAGSFYTGTNESNAIARGWKIDATGGAGGSACLRCINVPMGEQRRISFPMGSYSGGTPTFGGMQGTNLLKTLSAGSGLSYKISISNNNALNEKLSWSQTIGSDVINFIPQFSALSMDPNTFTGAASSCTYYITVSNSSDSDGTNVIYFDDLKFGYTAGAFTPSVFDFSSLLDSGLTGDKQQ